MKNELNEIIIQVLVNKLLEKMEGNEIVLQEEDLLNSKAYSIEINPDNRTCTIKLINDEEVEKEIEIVLNKVKNKEELTERDQSVFKIWKDREIANIQKNVINSLSNVLEHITGTKENHRMN